MKLRYRTAWSRLSQSDSRNFALRIIALIWLLYAATIETSAALAAAPLNSAVQKTPVRLVNLKASEVTGNTVTLTWRQVAPLDMQWIQVELWLPHQDMWSSPKPTYVSNETTQYVYGGLYGSMTYRFMVCGLKGDKDGKVRGPHICTNDVTVKTPRALNASGALGSQLRVPPVFVISAIAPAATGFQLCSGLTGLVGRYAGSRIETSDLGSSICAHGRVTIAQTNPQVNVMQRKLRLIVTHESRDGFGLNFVVPEGTRTDIFEQAFAGNTTLTFQVAFASGRHILGWSGEGAYLASLLGSRPWPLNFAVEFSGSPYVRSDCTYQAAAAAVACK